MIVYLLWALVFVGLAIVLLLTTFLMRGERLARVLEVQLNGLGETHRLGFEALAMSLDRLEKRVKVVEDEVL